ncbi:MAG: hypothetical protein GQE15_02055 [Archangiaceae bacterium]|nr:hypothetical protein [Archangiaceae bacterium]
MKCVLLISLVASGAAADPLSRRLSTIDVAPTKAELVELGGAPRLLALTKPEHPFLVRRAAIAALAHFPTVDVRDALVTLSGAGDEALRKTALDALSFAFVDDVVAEQALVKALKDESPMLRRAAIRGLARRTTSTSLLALEQQATAERDSETRATLSQALTSRR